MSCKIVSCVLRSRAVTAIRHVVHGERQVPKEEDTYALLVPTCLPRMLGWTERRFLLCIQVLES